MIKVFPDSERGELKHGWLHAKFSFSFNTYHNPSRLHYKNLRVLNEDKILPEGGFDMHSHSDMEIITYVISGDVAHKDNLGNQYTIGPGQIQRMTAGSGITHSEFNPSKTEVLHLLQIWVFPKTKGLEPSYEMTDFEGNKNSLVKIISPSPEVGQLKIHQDCEMYVATLEEKQSVQFKSGFSSHMFFQLIEGSVELNGTALLPGDVVYVEEEEVEIVSTSPLSHFILIDQ